MKTGIQGTGFALWLAAGSCIAALLVLTAVWLGPTNRRFLTRSFPIEEVPSRLEVWMRIHTVRVTLAAAAVLLGIIAFSSRRGAVRHR